MAEKIDLVVPYVDASDPEWQRGFAANNKSKSEPDTNGRQRFRGQGEFFRYFFRSISKFLPWVENVFLLVQSDSQVPKWLDTDAVTVVKHDEFIPTEYLPTYNSTTIEMFVWNIPGLHERFIYMNDDQFFLAHAEPKDFFSAKGVKASGKAWDFKRNDSCRMYQRHVCNCWATVNGLDPKRTFDSGECWEYGHIPHPMLKSKAKECFDLHKGAILSGITAFRDEGNHNFSLFEDYMLCIGMSEDSPLGRGRIIFSDAADLAKSVSMARSNRFVTVEDSSEAASIYDDPYVNFLFNEMLPNECRYERYGTDELDARADDWYDAEFA